MKIVMLGWAVVVALSCAAVAGEEHGFSQALYERSVRDARRAGSHGYVIALVEVIGDGDCHEARPDGRCVMETKVVEFLDGQYPAGGRMPTAAGAIEDAKTTYVGDRALVIAKPLPERGDLYGWDFAVSRPTKDDVDRMRDAIDAVAGEIP